MNLDEQESQLSAMFDGELRAAECELLARRLGKDQELRARWARYALVGAALRADPAGRSTQGDFARRVQAAIKSEPAAAAAPRRTGFWRVAVGGSVAAAVAAGAIFGLRADLGRHDAAELAAARTAPVETVVATAAPAVPSEEQVVVRTGGDSNEPESYVVPTPAKGNAPAMPASLASFVVAHSEYSSPLVRRSLLSTLVNSDQESTRAEPARGK